MSTLSRACCFLTLASLFQGAFADSGNRLVWEPVIEETGSGTLVPNEIIFTYQDISEFEGNSCRFWADVRIPGNAGVYSAYFSKVDCNGFDCDCSNTIAIWKSAVSTTVYKEKSKTFTYYANQCGSTKCEKFQRINTVLQLEDLVLERDATSTEVVDDSFCKYGG